MVLTEQRRPQTPSISTNTPGIPAVDYEFPGGDYWTRVPAWQSITREEFADYRWQQRNCIKSVKDIEQVFDGKISPGFIEDVQAGLQKNPMQIRMTPHIFSLIDWANPMDDPLRKQFLPVRSQHLENHPYCQNDSLGEDDDRVTPYLVHRYPDKVLFLPVSVCPVYCSYCTRSRLVGGSTSSKTKSPYISTKNSWDDTFAYLRAHEEVEDVVISGGDAFMLRAEQIALIGKELLDIPHIRRFRFATKGLAVMPMKILGDEAWFKAIQNIADEGQRRMKEVCIHTHFNSDHEITEWTEKALQRLSVAGIQIRNQSVLLRGVNDSFEEMYKLIKKLSYLNIQPYYVYVHDMVPDCEHLRTTLERAETLSKELQGTIAGFNMPRFVCDAPGGGGKRQISSYEQYDAELGVSAWTSPRIKPGEVFYYFDPIEELPDAGQRIWENPAEYKKQVAEFQYDIQESLDINK